MNTAIAIDLIDVMGTDLSVVDAARVSFAKRSAWAEDDDGDLKLSERDRGLVSYLARNGHWSPFAHTALSFRIHAPIFVARQLAKHQVGLAWNEVSRRYVDDEPEVWWPDAWRRRPDETIKQGSGGPLAEDKLERAAHLQDLASMSQSVYADLISLGIAPEQARMVLPLNTMTTWIWTGSLYAFARVCRERLAPDAQAETAEVAALIAANAAQAFPACWAALAQARGEKADV